MWVCVTTCTFNVAYLFILMCTVKATVVAAAAAAAAALRWLSKGVFCVHIYIHARDMDNIISLTHIVSHAHSKSSNSNPDSKNTPRIDPPLPAVYTFDLMCVRASDIATIAGDLGAIQDMFEEREQAKIESAKRA
jgi:hypothetical protein